MPSSLLDALPLDLRGADTTITPIAAGLSGAGVYRVARGEQAFVLKVSAPPEPVETWLGRVRTQQHAGEAGLAARVIHVDDARRAVLSEFVAGGSFLPHLRNPETRHDAIARLGYMVRQVHTLPIPDGAAFREPRTFIAELWQNVSTDGELPSFAREIVEALLAEDPPLPGPIVLSHNDFNPSNLVFDGARLCVLDWDVASANEAFYDLAAIAFFFRMDDAATRALLEACDGRPCAQVPARLGYDRRVVGTISGVASLGAALRNGYVGASGDETLDSTPNIDQVYARLRDGSLSLATAAGQWIFGLSMINSALRP